MATALIIIFQNSGYYYLRENIVAGENLKNAQIKTGFDWYDWAKANGKDVTQFEKYVSSMNDPYLQKFGEL